MKGYDGANSIDVLRRFLEIPLGSADGVFDRFLQIPGAIYRGEGLNRFLYVRGARPNKVLLVAHADTYWDHEYEHDPGPTRKIKIEDGNITAVDEEFGLGADDRAGCAMLWLLKDLGHSLLVTNGEEKGQLGSSWLMSNNEDIADEINTITSLSFNLTGAMAGISSATTWALTNSGLMSLRKQATQSLIDVLPLI
jgi:hypothetical protein